MLAVVRMEHQSDCFRDVPGDWWNRLLSVSGGTMEAWPWHQYLVPGPFLVVLVPRSASQLL